MKCFVAILEDRHIDTEVVVFLDASKAIQWAKKAATEGSRGGEIEEHLTDAMVRDGWVYNCVYSCEGDAVRVVAKQVNE